MVLTEDSDDQLFKKHQGLVNNLKLDNNTSAEAWESYHTIRTNYTLEGDQLHWLGCAIYVACRKQNTQTLGGHSVEGNYVSLTSLLRCCDLSVSRFFHKIERWADMANLPVAFRQKIEALQANFSVSCNIFREFSPMFGKIFKEPVENDTENKHRNRKQKSPPCTSLQLFEFSWLLFITVKGEDPSCSIDLVVSYHLLQSCCDLMFKNIFLDDRRDLLNPDFDGLPEDWALRSQVKLQVPNQTSYADAPCIIDKLCKPHTNMVTDAKYVKQYSWKPLIEELFKNDVLKGDAKNFTGILNQSNFDLNFKSLSKMYEAYLLHKGDFDERIFMAEHRRRLLLKEQFDSANTDSTESNSRESSSSNMNSVRETNAMHTPSKEANTREINSQEAGSPFEEILKRVHKTPLTNRQYLGPKEHGEGAPLSDNQSIAKLQALLADRSAGPSELLLEIFRSYEINQAQRNPTEMAATGSTGTSPTGGMSPTRPNSTGPNLTGLNSTGPNSTGPNSTGINPTGMSPPGPNSTGTTPTQMIDSVITELSNRFIENYVLDSTHAVQIDYANQRLDVAVQLFYRFLESILKNERTLNTDMSRLIGHKKFYESLFTCALEIVIFSYNSQKKFPWILSALEVSPFYFIRVIELIVRSKDISLTRDVVKHLNTIEEMILDSELWKSSCIFWEELKKPGVEIPKFEEIALPGSMVYTDIKSKNVHNAENSQNTNNAQKMDKSNLLQSPSLKQSSGLIQSSVLHSSGLQSGLQSSVLQTSGLIQSGLIQSNIMQSPGPSAVDQFDSPMSNVKKALFSTVKPGQSLLSQNQKAAPLHFIVTDQQGNKKYVPIMDAKLGTTHLLSTQIKIGIDSNQFITVQQTDARSDKPKKNGAFNIIFRKIYNLAGVRMDHLCNNLGILDSELKCKIWTTFEHALTHYTFLFQDRHLDQLLMCAVYVICKVTDNIERSFTDIMHSYKSQPQSNSTIYRNVLLYRANERDDSGNLLVDPKTGNLIQFYNSIFVKHMTSFAVKFSSKSSQNCKIPISPMPFTKSLMASPMQQVTKNIRIKNQESPGQTPGGRCFYYYFNRSNSKNLSDINRAISNNGVGSNGVTRKRSFMDDSFEAMDHQKRLCSNRKVQALLEERRIQSVE